MSGSVSSNQPTPAQDVAKIHGLLSDNGFLGHDENDHLHQVSKLLSGLNSSDLHQVLTGLSQGDLKKLGSEIDDGGTPVFGGLIGNNGLSSGERQSLFNQLASHSTNGMDLARLSGDLSCRDDIQGFGNAIAAHATDATKLGYISGMAPSTTQQNDANNFGFGYSTSTTGSPQANAVGSVLASLKGHAVDQALGSLNDQQLGAVMKAAEGETLTTTSDGFGAATTVSYDTSKLAAINNAAASGSDPAQKARVFEADAKALKDINGSNTLFTPDPTAKDEAHHVADAMTGLLKSDTTGVVNALNNADESGHAATTYAKEMISEGRTSDVGNIIARLQQGNDLSHNPIDFVNTQVKNPYGQDYYQNAENLGYFTGAVEAGINQITSDQNAQGNLLSNIFTTVVSAGASWAGPEGKAAAQVVNGLTRQAITGVVSSLASGDKSLRDSINDLSLPRDPKTHDRYRGPADPYFMSSQSTVIEQNS